MNECRKVRALLALPRADWSAGEKSRIEAHLPGCAACTAIAEAYAAQDRWSRAEPPRQLTPAQRSQVLARVRAEQSRPAPGRLSAVLGGAGALAVIALLAVSLALLFARQAEQELAPGTGQRESPASTAAVQPTARPVPAQTGAGKLAWVQDGDIWTRILPDGQPVRLTSDGRNSEPRWSPSGDWLAWRKDLEVWLVRSGGQDAGQNAYSLNAGVVNTFAWSPVDDRLAYVAGSGTLRLQVIRAGETEPLTLLPPGGDGQPGRMAWRPDGRHIAYEWRRGADYQGLWQIPADGGEPVELYDSGFPQRGDALLAGWSAGGETLFFWQGDITSASILADGVPFYALPAAGGQPQLLAGGDDVVLYHDAFWSVPPAGGRVALTVGAGRETWTNKRTVVIDPETGQRVTLTTGPVTALAPAFSADAVAYVASPDVGAPDAGSPGGEDAARAALGQRHIWLVGLDGLEPRQLTTDPAYRDERPHWSADGSHLLFVRLDGQERISLWLLPLGADTLQQVADGLGPLPDPTSGSFGTYGHVIWDVLFDWWDGPSGAGSPVDAPSSETLDVVPGVAALLENPPIAGETVELDAYFSGTGAIPMRGGPPGLPDQVSCPTNTAWAAALTDRPFPAMLRLLNGRRSNVLPADAGWLVATTPEATQPGRTILPQLPYLSRLRGHLGDPAFDHCPNADRILVVEQVVETYQEQPPEPAGQMWALPADYQAWRRYEDAGLGYSLPYPPGWTVAALDEPNVLSAIAVQDPQGPGYPVVVRVHAGETYYDQYDPASLPPLLQGIGFGVYEQGWAFDQPVPDSQHLSGFTVDRSAGSEEGQTAVLISAHGYTYELALTYPTGFDASQSLLTVYSAMVEGFHLASPPGPTATPPIQEVLGPGPFLSEEEAFDMVRQRDGQDVELWDAALLSEAEARRQADACHTFSGHPDGVWRLVVRGPYEGMTRTLTLFLDAMTGEQLCGEEVVIDTPSAP